MGITESVSKLQVRHVFAGLILVIRRRRYARPRRKFSLIKPNGSSHEREASTDASFSPVEFITVFHGDEDNPQPDGEEIDQANLTSFMHHEYNPCMNTITTIPELVKAFGGTCRFAEFLEIVPGAVSNMLRDECIPRGYHLQVYLEAKKRGITLDLHALGMAGRPKQRPLAGAAA